MRCSCNIWATLMEKVKNLELRYSKGSPSVMIQELTHYQRNSAADPWSGLNTNNAALCSFRSSWTEYAVISGLQFVSLPFWCRPDDAQMQRFVSLHYGINTVAYFNGLFSEKFTLKITSLLKETNCNWMWWNCEGRKTQAMRSGVKKQTGS